MNNLWEQQTKESSKAFAAFIAYRDMGLTRSCAKVAEQLKITPPSVLELSKRHNWQNRVRAWDAHVDSETQREQIEAVKIMKQRQIALALSAQEAADRGLKTFIAQFNDDGGRISPYATKPDALAKLLEMGCRIERLNRDEPERSLEFSQGSKFDNLSLEECEHLRSLIAKAEGVK
ncbi:hypothetical protein E6Q11_03775 [Candidatus Dojkabacteria bacterium]|uniref:Uncharacterized protein n=1 Tax=Candidatus Dojkabacteria bacterium TaxID=2099670 RepID=A0A5C7J5V4_9BACT|nr:MAG: hypothetical protein E6Q11_03775 [Candidatus Dojkabacteria bacterium]